MIFCPSLFWHLLYNVFTVWTDDGSRFGIQFRYSQTCKIRIRYIPTLKGTKVLELGYD